ncbi:protein argonaute-2-like isoform X1 [Hermetia illucens]|uniref:protein argonaute-2-like isoform X1 n=1 Tax=Hermetia illucens TaxID=343691 RepID=UPI0018CBF7DA|nr:protein argonaute-2-like isoform X1 [Hermetia illucens]
MGKGKNKGKGKKLEDQGAGAGGREEHPPTQPEQKQDEKSPKEHGVTQPQPGPSGDPGAVVKREIKSEQGPASVTTGQQQGEVGQQPRGGGQQQAGWGGQQPRGGDQRPRGEGQQQVGWGGQQQAGWGGQQPRGEDQRPRGEGQQQAGWGGQQQAGWGGQLPRGGGQQPRGGGQQPRGGGQQPRGGGRQPQQSGAGQQLWWQGQQSEWRGQQPRQEGYQQQRGSEQARRQQDDRPPPGKAVESKFETLSVSSTSSEKSKMSSKTQTPIKGVLADFNLRTTPPDPKNWCGQNGTQHPIEANYVKIIMDKMRKVAYQYDVQFNLERPTRFRPVAFEQLRTQVLSANAGQRGNFLIAFDGKNIAYSAVKVPPNFLGVEHVVQFIDGETNANKEIKITMKEARDLEIDLMALKNYHNTGIGEKPLRALQCIDVVLRTPISPPSRKSKQAGRAFYTKPTDPKDLGDQFDLWLGLYQSATLGDSPMLNIDVAHKGFPRDSTLQDVYLNLNRNFDQADSYIRNLNIIYTPPACMNGACKLYKANGLAEPANRKTFINDETQTSMTIEEYYRSKNYSLRNPDFPCVSVGTVRRIYLPIELCKVQRGQNIRARAGPDQTRALIGHAATSTTIRKSKIFEMFNSFRHNANDVMQGFRLSLDSEFIKVIARNIQPPTIQYKENSIMPQKGSWRADRSKYLQPAPLQKFGILITTRANDGAVVEFAKKIINEARKNDMDVQDKYELSKALQVRSIREKLQKLKKAGCSIVFVIIDSFADTYSKVKQIAEIDLKIVTQCVKWVTVQKKMDQSTIANIFLKVNAKLNGVNHMLRPSMEIKFIKNTAVMLLGADVTHPSPDQSHIPSVVGVVASHDVNAFQYNACWRLQDAKKEMIEDMENIVLEQLHFFNRKRNQFPTHIIYYRDGVSDGQFKQLEEIELSAINRAFARVKPNYKPKLTCLVVQKRHHTRFFPPVPSDIVHPRDRNQNVLPGTVVDTTITHPGEKQFFLVSHESIQGTAKPSKYCVIRDDNNFDPDSLQAVTYALCHMFTRCNRAVSYPAPAYYAHLMAARGRVLIDGVRLDMSRLAEEYRRRCIDTIKVSNPMFFV